MAKCKVHTEKSYEIVLKVGHEEGELLMNMMQNPLRDNETSLEASLRETIFSALRSTIYPGF